MEIEFDSEKNKRNVRERGVPFTLAAEFDFSSALIVEDNRRNYGETRYQAIGYIGYIGSRLHVLVFTLRGEVMRVIKSAQGESTRNKAV
ncbi:MAG: BrnT family toxin [Methylohalobius crimeensis]